MLRDRFVDVRLLRALGREIARGLDAEVDDPVGFGLGERRGEMDRPVGLDRRPIRPWRDRARAARAGDSCPARPPSRGRGSGNNRRSPRAGSPSAWSAAGVADDEVVVAEMVEQGLEPLLEQRQPMLHAGHAPAVGERLVERILGRGRAELLAIARAEALDAVRVEQRLGRGHQRERLGLVGRALVGGVEAADALDLVAEEIEPERQLLAGREQVDQRAAHGIFAMLGDGVGALIAERVQLRDQSLALDPLARGDAPRELADAERRQQSLRRGACGGDEQLRLVALGLQRAERRQPLGHDAQRRGGAVVGQAVPAGKRQHLDLGREQRHGFGERAHRRFVGDDRDGAAALARSRARRARDRRRATAGSRSARRRASAA